MNRLLIITSVLLALVATGCRDVRPATEVTPSGPDANMPIDKYTTVRLTADFSAFSPEQRQMIPILIDAAKEMDTIFQMQAYGNLDSLLATISDPKLRASVQVNYGPWDRLENDEPFVPGVGPRPEGANFYPEDMTKEEFDRAAAQNPDLKSLYTMVRRDANGNLIAIPYHTFFSEHLQRAAEDLRAASRLAEDPGLKHYLELRADALLTDDFQPSDLAWMDMKNNTIGMVVGPIETYQDQLFGYKAANEAYVLVKDLDWSQRLAHYIAFLPMLQNGLPVPEAYKQETPGTDSDLNAYDAIYYAGDANAGAKTIAINLPNDEEVQLEKGTRRLQLKNAMRAKFDKILVPISDMLIAEEQRPHITFDAFFSNTMFHEVAHGLGIKNTLNGKGTVREALREHASALEEGKADVLGLYMIQKLKEAGELDTDLMDNYVTFLASILRSVRFGTADAHGRANMVRFNYFKERNAFTRDEQTGTYHVNREQFEQAVSDLSADILKLQGDGDYDAVAAFVQKYGTIDVQLQSDLNRLASGGIPVDIVFEQGMSVLK
ncbi:MAG TPA: Zn-dependent hydrolase [Rhodothermales bacterium]|nr:Zn-dependent hydrolase [Rhodothermales bacterium]